jgi:hypothetical protein
MAYLGNNRAVTKLGCITNELPLGSLDVESVLLDMVLDGDIRVMVALCPKKRPSCPPGLTFRRGRCRAMQVVD